MTRPVRLVLCCLAATYAMLAATAAQETLQPGDLAAKARKLQKEGNHKEAYSVFRRVLLELDSTPTLAVEALNESVACLQRINRISETDALREAAIARHSDDWRLLRAAALSYFNANHHGFIVAGEFSRGPHRGGGRYANSTERDRVRALQLMEQALPLAAGDTAKREVAGYYLDFARVLLGFRGHSEAWRLQYLTDTAALPDHEEGYGYGHHGGSTRGAPVDADGKPVFHDVPLSYESAATDGERWRWLLVQAMELDAVRTNTVLATYAAFLQAQFGVQTMAHYGRFFHPQPGNDDSAKAGTYALHGLAETETMARTATGIKRFDLPVDANFIKLLRRIADNPETGGGEEALSRLAQIFENRRQYTAAAALWQRSIKEYGPGRGASKQQRIDQIAGNWGRFEPTMTHPAGKSASVEYRFRNGTKVDLQAHRILVRELLTDVKDYITSNPARLDWGNADLGNIGMRLVQDNSGKYVGEEVAAWSVDVTPDAGHFDRQVTVKTPLREAGAYLLTATMDDGNVSKIVVWINDTVIVKKGLDGKTYFFLADAVTGRPVPEINVEFFGFRQEYDRQRKRHDVHVTRFAEYTDALGQIMPSPEEMPDRNRWLVIASTTGGRLAFLGFSNVWYGRHHDQEYNQTKVYTITDRPVYRPDQNVQFKLWVRHARYDQEDTSTYAGKTFTVQINNPKGEKVFEKPLVADSYGGMDGEFALPSEAELGVYRLQVVGHGGGTFRVEEYKKPEFEVTVEAPDEPVMLGETVAGTVKARYYFGAPVTKARVRYKVLRSDHSANWYPLVDWDWFYGPGYWWFAYNYDWYPGWQRWGCLRPVWSWWPTPNTPPEVVAEAEVEIGADGTVPISIDTSFAKEMQGDRDHSYEITVEVTDESRRTIVGKGKVLVAREPFKVYAWVDRGHYRAGDVVQASFQASTLDGKPVQGQGQLILYRVAYLRAATHETAVEEWDVDTDDQGQARLQITAAQPGQYRLSYVLTDAAGHSIEGGYVFSVIGPRAEARDFRFSQIELVPDSREYSPGDTVRLRINTDREDATVVLFVRPVNGVYLPPTVLALEGKSVEHPIPVTKKDMPNFFVEAFTVSDGKLYTDTREIAVPPEKRVLNVEVQPSADSYKPGEQASVGVRLTDHGGNPFAGTAVMSVYDRSVDYIAGGSNVPEIREFFWKWRRHHRPSTESNLDRWFNNIVLPKTTPMGNIGVFGHVVPQVGDKGGAPVVDRQMAQRSASMLSAGMAGGAAMPMAADGVMGAPGAPAMMNMVAEVSAEGAAAPPSAQPVAVRSEFADTAFWVAALATDADGRAEVSFKMPDNLTGWKIRTWGMGHGTVVGEGSAEVVTAKDLMLRLQAPRFFVETDEVVLSANIHNYLDADKSVQASLELDGGCLEPMGPASRTVSVSSGSETRVDWRVKVTREGEATVRMKAVADTEADAMQMAFPVYVHGMLKTDSFCGVIRPEEAQASVAFTVPAQRRVEQTRLEVRYSPTLAGALVDALPYLADYPYGCTEQTLNRFLPAVITHKVLQDLGVDMAALRDRHTNLNAQERGDDAERAAQWRRWKRSPVFDPATIKDMVRTGLRDLAAMQLSDGGWGWFSGWGERSYPHTTAVVVHGLQTASESGVAVVPDLLNRGVEWLRRHQAEQVRRLKNADTKAEPWKGQADNIDALVYMVLSDAGIDDVSMRGFLYRDRDNLAVYGKALLGMGLHRGGHADELAMVMRNIEQVLVEDEENHTAYLDLPNGGYWWYWYGSEYEAHAYYLMLLSRLEPESRKAAGLVKYLLNNRKHATYWNATRDTALCIEAMAEYLQASGEGKPDMTVKVALDGRIVKEVRIAPGDLFTFDSSLQVEGTALATGDHELLVTREGTGPVYFNAYLENFTLEDFIERAGLEIRVNRHVYKLERVDKTVKAEGARGQVLDRQVEKYERRQLPNMALLKSGDLVEVELEIESKNDYEYIVLEDMKAAGFEPVEVRSGYGGNDLGAYMQLRDERVAFLVRRLARGRHSVSYRMRAETPGRFSALPARAYAMYAPELRANSDEIKLRVED